MTRPRTRPALAVALLALCATALLAPPVASATPEEAVRGHVRALEGLGALSLDEATEAVHGRLAPGFAAELDAAELRESVETIRRAAASAGAVMVEGDEQGILLKLRGAHSLDVRFRVEEDAPHRITALSVSTDVEPLREGPEIDVSWDTLHRTLERATEDGFAGTVLAVRDGEIVLHRGYGLADRKTGTPAGTETVYGIGSMPIDFTRAAILLLAQRGELSLDDPITRFLPDVPEDKRSMTLEHLASGRSGLPNFHHVVGVDEDYDLSWIDRETAIERILGQPLLFAPGEGRAHSHSAWGLLAAIVEIVSGVTYEEFLEREFFGPAGMERTGPYGDDLGLPASAFAVGYGESRVGDPNIPPNWGPTSWLVKGSGGMVSNPGDMRRFDALLESGRVLRGEWQRRMTGPGVGIGGSDRGFYFLRADDGEGTAVYLASHVDGRTPLVEALSRAIRELVMGEAGPG